jgi:hypothetical protein
MAKNVCGSGPNSQQSSMSEEIEQKYLKQVTFVLAKLYE